MSLLRLAKTSGLLSRASGNISRSALGLSSSVLARNVYTDEQLAKGRFASPCLSIYRIQMGAVSSGANRLTGMGLVGGVGLLGMAAFICDPMQGVEWMKSYPLFLYSTKFLTSYCLLYHIFDGARHFYFQYFPDKLTMKFILASSYALYFGVGAIALGLTICHTTANTKKEITN